MSFQSHENGEAGVSEEGRLGLFQMTALLHKECAAGTLLLWRIKLLPPCYSTHPPLFNVNILLEGKWHSLSCLLALPWLPQQCSASSGFMNICKAILLAHLSICVKERNSCRQPLDFVPLYYVRTLRNHRLPWWGQNRWDSNYNSTYRVLLEWITDRDFQRPIFMLQLPLGIKPHWNFIPK